MLAFNVSESGVKPASRSLGKRATCRAATSGAACSSAGRNSVSVVTRHELVALREGPDASPGVGVLLREAGDLAGGALLRGVVLVAVDGEAVLLVLEDEAVTAGMLVPAGSVVPELGKVAPDRRVVPGQDDVGVRVAAEAGRRELFGGEAAADLVPPLEHADAHAAVLDQIQREQERLVSSTDEHGIEGLVSHSGSLAPLARGSVPELKNRCRVRRARTHRGARPS